MKHIVIPGVASVSAASVGYVLFFGRTIYSALAMLMGLGLGGQKLDPATLSRRCAPAFGAGQARPSVVSLLWFFGS